MADKYLSREDRKRKILGFAEQFAGGLDRADRNGPAQRQRGMSGAHAACAEPGAIEFLSSFDDDDQLAGPYEAAALGQRPAGQDRRSAPEQQICGIRRPSRSAGQAPAAPSGMKSIVRLFAISPFIPTSRRAAMAGRSSKKLRTRSTRVKPGTHTMVRTNEKRKPPQTRPPAASGAGK